MRLVCPDAGISRSKKRKEIEAYIADWIYNESFRELLKSFNIDIPGEGTLREHIEKLWSAIQIWDFRKGDERWNIRTDDPRIDESRDLIDLVSRKLGLLDITDTVIDSPDFILPLGGARMTNYNTPLKARELIDEKYLGKVSVVGLSTFRPTAERDKPHYEKYAPGAGTEFEAMCGGLVKAFELSGDYTGHSTEDDNLYLCSESRIYKEGYKEGVVAAISAPSSSPETRRANTLDTFAFFLDEFEVSPGSKIILTTNSIYVPAQFMKLMKTALDRELVIDCVGVQCRERVPEGKLSMYLQEIKATVDAIHDFIL